MQMMTASARLAEAGRQRPQLLPLRIRVSPRLGGLRPLPRGSLRRSAWPYPGDRGNLFERLSDALLMS